MAVFARQIEAGRGIEGSAERVWQVLTDFQAYPEWNPFISGVEGAARSGSKIRVTMQPPGGRAMTFRPRVRESEPPLALRWLGRVGVPWVFDGSHSFEIEPLRGGGVHFRQSERFSGLLVPLLGRTIRRTEEGFTQMNDALARRVEEAESQPPSREPSGPEEGFAG